MRDVIRLNLLLEIFQYLIPLPCDLVEATETIVNLVDKVANPRTFVFILSFTGNVQIQ